MDHYLTTSAPHIRSSGNVPEIIWKVNLSLLPAISASLIFFGVDAARIFVVTVLAAIVGEVVARKLFFKPKTLYDGSAVLTGILLFLMLPPSIPSWMAGLGAFGAIFFGKEIFGGLGANPFNPALVGRAFLQISFPNVMSWAAIPDVPEAAIFLIVAFLIGGGILIWQNLIFWEVPLLHMAIIYFLSSFVGVLPWRQLEAGAIFLIAIYVITDPVTTPLSRYGNRVVAIATAVLALILKWYWQDYLAGVVFAVLIVNAFTPWIDHWVHISVLKRNHKW